MPSCPLSDPPAQGHAWLWSGPCTLPAVREAGSGLRAFLESHGVEREELAAWELLISEAGNNIVLNAGGDPAEMRWDIDAVLAADRILVRIHDRTAGFDFPETAGLPDESAESGRGLFLIFALTGFRKYERRAGKNTLTLRRSYACPPRVDAGKLALEATLNAMTEELASCYESLSAIFRFTAEGRQTTDIRQFSDRLLQHLVTVTRADCGMIRIVQGQEISTLAANGCPPPGVSLIDCTELPLEGQAIATRQDQWIEPAVFPAEMRNAMPRAGLVHPFYHEDELMGIISLGRHESAEPLNAGEVSVVHTFAEFFTQHVLSRRHEETAIRASVARREFELAAAIQKSLLPPPLVPVHGISVAGHCQSALAIGGDFYDVIPWESYGYFFVIGDVMGKGVAASMMAAVTRSVFRSLQQLYQTPARALERAGRLLFGDMDRLEMFVTVAVGVVDGPRRTLRIANAGHCPVVVALPDGTTVEVPPDGPPLGILRTPEFHETEIPLTPGLRLLAYSDGLTDPRNDRPCFSQSADVARWLGQAAAERPGVEELKRMLQQHLAYAEETPEGPALADDQTFLFLAWDPSESSTPD